MTTNTTRRSPAVWAAQTLDPATLWSGFRGWLSGRQHSTISFSVMRVLLSVGMLAVLVPSLPDRLYLWGPGSWWVEPEARRRGWWEPLRLIFSKESVFWFDVAYGALLVLVLLFLVGWKTRWVTPVLLVFWVGLSTNSTLLTNGGDTLMRIVLLFAVFANLSAHFSVDAWVRRRRPPGAVAPRRRIPRPPEWVANWTHNTVLILCVYQILLVYLVSSVLKLAGEEWLEGTAIYYALSIDQFRVLPVLSDTVWQFTPAVMMATWTALWVQLLFPVLILWRPTRYVAIFLITGMHLGIAVLLGLWPFSLTMIALDLLLIRDRSWVRAGGWATRAGRAARRVVSHAWRGDHTRPRDRAGGPSGTLRPPRRPRRPARESHHPAL
ncbi:HTTM domain-containing protein [Microbacterium sp. P07]|uniref:HTTM domain-containing protein n=1 Tax=Microbacterium sp. P07 TaxID=3366952 RepID=UPI0037461BB1